MQEYIEIGSSPTDEECVQVGTENYEEHAQVECHRFLDLLRKKFGKEPEGARLAIKSFPHDFGIYYEVVCHFEDQNKKAMDYAFRCEGRGPKTWEK